MSENPEIGAELADLRSRMPNASPADAADAVLAFADQRSRLFLMARFEARAVLCAAEASAILNDPKQCRRRKKALKGAALHEEARFYLERAMEVARDELAVMRETYRHALIELGRTQLAAGYLASHAHHLEEALRMQTGIDIRDHMPRA